MVDTGAQDRWTPGTQSHNLLTVTIRIPDCYFYVRQTAIFGTACLPCPPQVQDQHLVPIEHLTQGQHLALGLHLSLHAGLPQGELLLGQHSQELALTHDQSVWLHLIVLLAELLEKDDLHVLDDLIPVIARGQHSIFCHLTCRLILECSS